MKINNVKTNYFFNLLYQVINLLIPIITIPYISRVLGVENIGIYSYTLGLVTYFVFFISAIGGFGQREIAIIGDNKKQTTLCLFDLSILKFIFGLIFACLFIFGFANSNDYSFYLYLQLIVLFANVIDVTWLFQGKQEFKKIVSRSIIFKILCTIAIFIFVRDSDSLWIYILIMGLSTLLSNIVMMFYLPKYIQKINFFELRPFRYFLGCLKYFIPFIAIEIYTLVDKTMLHYITGGEIENGYYEQATKIIRLCLTVITALGTVKAPYISELYTKGETEEIKNSINKSFDLITIICFPMMFGILAVSKTFIPIYLGNEFEKCISLIMIFSPVLIFSGMSNIIANQYLIPIKEEKKYTIATIVGAIINLSLNLLLIKYYGSIGAIFSSMICEFIVMLILILFTYKKLNYKYLFKVSIKPLVASLIMFSIVYPLTYLDVNKYLLLIIQLFFGILIYFSTILILRDSRVLLIAKKFINNFVIKNDIKRKDENSLLYVAQGIMCLLIVFLHKQFPGTFGTIMSYIGSLGVSFFFIITGFSLQKYVGTEDFSSKIKLRLKRNLITALSCSIFYIFWDLIIVLVKGEQLTSYFNNIFNVKYLLEFFAFNNMNNFGSDIGILWYIWALVYAYIILLLLDKLKLIRKDNIKKWFVSSLVMVSIVNCSIILLSCFEVKIGYFDPTQGMFTRNWLFQAIPCIFIGLFINDLFKRFENKSLFNIISFLIISIVSLIAFQYFVYNILNASMASVNSLILITNILIFILCMKYNNVKIEKNVFYFIGKYLSRDIYLFHMVAIDIIMAILTFTKINTNGIIGYATPAFCAIFAIIISFSIYVLKNVYKKYKTSISLNIGGNSNE